MTDSDLFYLGKIFDQKTGKPGEDKVLLDPADLTTHAVITGMTGSGKTGLGIGLLEEAALHGLPAIVIDPKGDLTNLVLHFPDQAAKDFEPWIDPEAARRAGKTTAQLAEETAANWKNGLESWGLGREQLLALQKTVDFAIYTPGSSSGLPVNILSSFAAPELPWEENREVLREKIASTVTALLGLVGMTDIDPLKSREHILVSNLLENAWSQGVSLDMTELILQVQNPPMDRLGAFPMDSFFPEKDRFSLAMLLNNFLASPSFQAWLEGTPLEIGEILWTREGKPRHSVFYTAHLSENERMFFTTLLFAAIESWMRAQRGSSGLRALVYFDEIVGYLPPIANPPSRPIMLRMLKQARAFGIGLVLATQNPVDLDYKALSNAGTWMIGRLQTERDKKRLMDGLESLQMSIPRSELDKAISGLAKRVFLLHSVHAKGPRYFQTRWVLNYLAGPLTRTQIPDLNRLADAQPAAGGAKPAARAVDTEGEGKAHAPATVGGDAGVATGGASATKPALPAGIREYFLPASLGTSEAARSAGLQTSGDVKTEGIFYRPALLAQAEVRYLARKYNLEHVRPVASLLRDIGSGLVHWEEAATKPVDPKHLQGDALPKSQYGPLPGWLGDAKRLKSLEADFKDWIYRTGAIRVKANESLKVYADPEVTTAEFRERCSEAARKQMAAERDKIASAYEKKISTLQQKVRRQEMEVDEKKKQLDSRRLEELGTGAEFVLGRLLGGRKKSISSSITKRRMTTQSKANLLQEQQKLTDLQTNLDQLTKEQKEALDALETAWADKVNDVSEVLVNPAQQDIYIQIFGVAWQPFYLIKAGDREQEISAFSSDG